MPILIVHFYWQLSIYIFIYQIVYYIANNLSHLFYTCEAHANYRCLFKKQQQITLPVVSHSLPRPNYRFSPLSGSSLEALHFYRRPPLVLFFFCQQREILKGFLLLRNNNHIFTLHLLLTKGFIATFLFQTAGETFMSFEWV